MTFNRFALLSLLLSSFALADVALLPSGSTRIVSNIDAGTNIPVELRDSNGNPFISIEDGHMQVSQDMPLVSDRAVGTTLNTNVWTGNVTTQTITVSSGFINLNASAITTLNTTSQIQTIKQHSVSYADQPIQGVAVAKVSNLPLANSTAQLGFFSASALTAPTDGCYFEWNAAGEFRAVTNANGSILQSGVLTNPSVTNIHVFTVYLSYEGCTFVIDGAQVANIPTEAVSGVQPTLGPKLPYAARIVTSASAPVTAPSLQVGSVSTFASSSTWNKPFAHVLAGAARGNWQNPLTTFAKTGNYTASTAPTTRTLTATTTASETTLCGVVNVTPTTTAAADYILFDYTVPTGLQLYVTSVTCDFTVSGAAQPATALGIQWWVATNSSATTLATADALGPPPTAWAPRPIFFGASSVAASAAIGAGPSYHSARLDLGTVPLTIDSARHFQVGFRALQAQTATASEIFAISCACPGYFE